MSSYLLPLALIVLLALAFAISLLWQRSRPLALALAIGVPLAAAGFVAWRGVPAEMQAPPAQTAEQVQKAEVDALIDTAFADVDARIKADPEAADAWAMKGNLHMQLQQFEQARVAFKRAHELMPEDDVVAVAYGEAMMRSSPDLVITPEAYALFERAASATPPDDRAMFLVGLYHAQNDRPGAAAATWEQLLPRVEPAHQESLRQQITAARDMQARMEAAMASSGPAIAVTVEVAPALADRAPVGSVLYVFARPAGGGPPVALERVLVERWPVTVTLDDADSTTPATKLSGVANIEVSARLAHAGDAMAASGDLEADPAAARIGGKARLVLAKVRP